MGEISRSVRASSEREDGVTVIGDNDREHAQYVASDDEE